MDIRDLKPIGTKCARCQGQANVLLDARTPDGPAEEYPWTCPRCHTANTIRLPSKVVGVAIGEVYVIRSGQSD
jgi:hypothetical protein